MADQGTIPDGSAPGVPASPLERARAEFEALAVRDILALAVVLLVPVVYLPGTTYGHTTARLALLLTVLPWGLACTIRSARDGDFAARCGLGAMAAVVAATLFARHPFASFAGDIESRSSMVITLGYLACWGIGRRYGGPRSLLGGALLLGAGVQVAIITAQALLLDDVRPAALSGNPVFAATLFAGAAVVLAARSSTRGSGLAWAAGLLPVGYAIGVSGTRVALIAALVGVGLMRFRKPATLAVLILFLLAGTVLASTNGAASATSRLASEGGGGGFAPRAEMWRHGVDAWTERPVLGWGPGRFLEATSPRVTLAFVSRGEPRGRYSEAHNLFVESLTTTGLIGVLTLAAFVGVCLLRGRGFTRVVAFTLLVCHLVEPQSLVVTPLLFLFLGASLPRADTAVGSNTAAAADTTASLAGRGVSVGRSALAVATLAAVVLAVVVIGADMKLSEAELEAPGIDAAETAQRIAPFWPAPASLVGNSWLLENGQNPSAVAQRKAEKAADRALRLDPTRPQFLYERALLELRWGDPAVALDRFEAADRQAPWFPQILLSLRAAGRQAGRPEVAQLAEDQLCAIDPSFKFC